MLPPGDMAQHGELSGPPVQRPPAARNRRGKARQDRASSRKRSNPFSREKAGAAKRTTLSSGEWTAPGADRPPPAAGGRKTVVSMPLAMTVTGIPDRAEEAAARRAIQREQPTTVNRFHPS